MYFVSLMTFLLTTHYGESWENRWSQFLGRKSCSPNIGKTNLVKITIPAVYAWGLGPAWCSTLMVIEELREHESWVCLKCAAIFYSPVIHSHLLLPPRHLHFPPGINEGLFYLIFFRRSSGNVTLLPGFPDHFTGSGMRHMLLVFSG